MNQLSELFFQPFSAAALKLLPRRGVGMRAKSKRADRIPDDMSFMGWTNTDIVEKILTPVKVEAKVWFANERTFISYLSMGLLLSTIASGLLFGAKDSSARWFAFAYALIFGERIMSISTLTADLLWGPLVICLALFVAILVNFIFRLTEARRQMGVNPMSLQNAWYHAGVKGAWT
ncbi:hypothetical protein IAR55_003477 [Kwoniella newhampshirensis]|uniref:DUF202 domain-containing protein n=1 Tax=Kwoniella newhampshirensis TaxID=1651941 RepID=A0AAW0YYW0_9TREE